MVNDFRSQAAACRELGAPFTGALVDHAAADIEGDPGTVWQALAGLENAPRDAAVALRFAGAIHRLVLDGRAPALEARYPSVGGDGDAERAWPQILAVTKARLQDVREIMTRPPQTNEVGRAAALIGVIGALVERVPLPVRLLEIGASGGLNLRADCYSITAAGQAVAGPIDSPVELADAWHGPFPPRAPIEIAERRGCDPDPIDATSEDGALTLTQYVWPEQAERLARLRGALAIAREVPAELVSMDAAEFVAALRPKPGRWLVLWHSVMWQYLDAREQRAVSDRIDAFAAGAGVSAPFAHVSLEPDELTGRGFAVTVRTSPDVGLGLQPRVVARAAPHGLPVDWEDW
jgi:hypothetical protein